MKQQTVIDAAAEYAAQRFPNEKGSHCGTVALEQYACRKGFFAGIEYQKRQQIEQESCKNLKRYRYPKNGQIYIVRSVCRMKHPVTREWIGAVIYTQENGTEIYVREAEEFGTLRYDPNTCPTGNMMAKNIACKVGFRQGARWQRNHVWHKRTEQPKDGSLVLVMRGDVGLITGPNHDDWEDIVKELNLETWAYLSDLTPTSFDDILEANKDVLQRLKKGETK